MNTLPDNINEKLLAYLDGELNATEMEEVERYLEQNPSARLELMSLFEVRELLNKFSMPAPPAGMAKDIISKAQFAPRYENSGLIRLSLFAATVLIALMAWTYVLDNPEVESMRRNTSKIGTLRKIDSDKFASEEKWSKDCADKLKLERDEVELHNRSVVSGMAKSVVELDRAKGNLDTDGASQPAENAEGDLGKQGIKAPKDSPPGAPATGSPENTDTPTPKTAGYSSRGGGSKDKASPNKDIADGKLPLAEDSEAEKKLKEEDAGEPEETQEAGQEMKLQPPLSVINLAKTALWFTTGDTLVFKGGSVEITTTKVITLEIPNIGKMEIAANSKLRVTLYDNRCQQVIELPGLALRKSAEQCSISFRIELGSAVFTRNVGGPVTLGEPGGWVFDIDGRDHEYVD